MLMISQVQSSQVALLYVGPLFIKKETWISYMPLLQGILVRKYLEPHRGWTQLIRKSHITCVSGGRICPCRGCPNLLTGWFSVVRLWSRISLFSIFARHLAVMNCRIIGSVEGCRAGVIFIFAIAVIYHRSIQRSIKLTCKNQGYMINLFDINLSWLADIIIEWFYLRCEF